MRRYTVRRFLQMIPTILAILLLNFLLIRLAPGDPARVMAGEMATPENVEAIRERFGLDRPLPEQLLVYGQALARGDLGYSYNYLVPVSNLILGRLPQTILLVLSANLLSIVLGTIVGAYSASRFPSRIDSSIWISSLVFYSMPIFWFGMLLVFIFSRELGWLPSGGMRDIINRPTGLAGLMDRLRHAILPTLTLMAYFMPIFIRITRASVIETLGEDYITTVRAVGLTENRIFLRHALRNALLPTVTMAGLTLGFVVTGAVLTETVFGWPGVGLLFWQAITNRDYPVLMGIFVFTSISVVLASFLTDLAYALLDPRVRFDHEPAA
jgi:peptide/nickel transport system permease protein